MIDIVRLLEDFANSKGYIYNYGRKSVMNLIDTGDLFNGAEDKIYFLLEYRKIKPIKNATQTGIKANSFEGVFYLLKHSDLDQNFFDETGDQSTGKYVTNIEPLLSILGELDSFFGCSEVSYETFSADDITDFLDANCDGLMVNFKATIPV